MPALYVANPTRQIQVICYRLDYARDGELNANRQFQPHKQQPVQPGRQELIGARDFHMQQVEEIVRQLEPFGAVAVKDIQRLQRGAKVNYIFNVDKPVPSDAIRHAQAHNANAMIEEGRKRRQDAAVASNEMVQQVVQNQFLQHGMEAQVADSTTIGFEQLEQSEAGERRIEEGYEVVPEGKVGLRSGKPASAKGRRRGK